MITLNEFKKDVYSQSGEDGIIAEILQRIEKEHQLDLWCVELGAWDGVYFSNTCNLIRDKNYKAVLIEGEKKRLRDLIKNHPAESVIKICRFVDFEGPNSLDEILSKTQIPKNFDFLSIDIDGGDYYILQSLKKYSPKVISIEFNADIPNGVSYINPRNFGVKHGSSARAITELANSMGYLFVTATATNLFFIDETLIHSIDLVQGKIEEILIRGNDPTIIFSALDGSILSNKKEFAFRAHNLYMNIEELNVLPKYLREFPGDWNFMQKRFFGFYLRILRFQKIVRRRIVQ